MGPRGVNGDRGKAGFGGKKGDRGLRGIREPTDTVVLMDWLGRSGQQALKALGVTEA